MIIKVIKPQWFELAFGLASPTTTNFFHPHTTTLVVGEVDSTSMIVPPIGALHGLEANNLWIVAERLSKSKCLLETLSHALAMTYSTSATIKIEPKKTNHSHHN